MKKEVKKEVIARKNKGVISVYMCLMLAVVLSIVLIVIEAARVSAMKMNIECATDMGMDSVLAEYHRELLERYDLLFVDSSYSDLYGSTDKVADRIKEYMTYNLNPKKDLLLSGSRDLLKLNMESVDITKVSRATDNNGEVFKYMANSYMLENYGIGYIDQVKSLINVSEENKLFEGNIISDNEKAQNAINNIKLPEDKGISWNEVDKTNPTEAVNELRNSYLLSLVCEEGISTKSYDLSGCVSNRSLVKGNGLNTEWEDRSKITTELLFNEYILLKCGNYANVRKDSVLDYQVEYIIAGNDCDMDNLKNVAEKLLLIRGAANTVYFSQHQYLKDEAELLAEGLALVTFLPELKDVYKTAIIAAWILAESVYDVKSLFSGGKVPLIKSTSDWNLTLDKAMLMAASQMSNTKIDTTNKEGQSYEDYLRLLLYAEDKDIRTKRCMDIVEMDIRKASNKASFSLDDCIAAISFQIVVSSNFGYNFLIQRNCSYW